MDPDADAAAAAPPAPRLSSRLAQKRKQEEEEQAVKTNHDTDADEEEMEEEEGGKGKGGKGKKTSSSSNSGKRAKKGVAAATPAPTKLKGLASLPQSHWPLFKGEVLSLLTPKDIVRASGACKRFRRIFSCDEVWEPLLGKFGEGSLLKELEAGSCLSNPYNQPGGGRAKGCKEAYLAATTGKCKGCGAWTPLLNKLTLEMTCWPCFDTWRKSGQLMGKTKATEQYLLGAKEAAALPHVTIKDPFSTMFASTTFVVRAHCEALVQDKYEDGLAGLEVDREERQQKAKDKRADVMAKWEERKKKAVKEGKCAPKRPKESKVLSSKIDEKDTGFMVTIDGYAMEVLAWAGFVKKEDPSKPRSTAQDSTSIVFVCNWCEEARPPVGKHLWMRPMFPTPSQSMIHKYTCPHKPEVNHMMYDGFDGY